MKSWSNPPMPNLPGVGSIPSVFDSRSGALTASFQPGRDAEDPTLYVCGITPYDATHIGHAATYLTYDLLLRAWRDAGLRPRYAQNITDVDDPLLERATAVGVPWRELAAGQIELFRSDMAALGAIAPDAFVGVTESIDPIAAAVAELSERGFAYQLPVPAAESVHPDAFDVYFDGSGAQPGWSRGVTTPFDQDALLALSAEHGGDPERVGKRHPTDPLLWRAARVGEPAWPSPVGAGRPGWHVECSVIAAAALGSVIAVQGGGVDLRFPHHDFSAGHAAALGHGIPAVFHHVALVEYLGEKMSKSRGNLVFVSQLLAEGVAPGAIRLAIFASHYRTPWEWTAERLASANARFERWRAAFGVASSAGTPADGPAGSTADSETDGDAASSSPSAEVLGVLAAVRQAIANDLDVPSALECVDDFLDEALPNPLPVADQALLRATVQTLLGVSLQHAGATPAPTATADR